MKMRNYIKKKEERKGIDVEFYEIQEFSTFRMKRVKKYLFSLLAIIAIALPLVFVVNNNKVNVVELSEVYNLKINEKYQDDKWYFLIKEY